MELQVIEHEIYIDIYRGETKFALSYKELLKEAFDF